MTVRTLPGKSTFKLLKQGSCWTVIVPLPGSGYLFRKSDRREFVSVEEERELARRSQLGDREAADRLLRAHLGFIESIARKYRRYGVPMNDLVQEGAIGLLQAIRKFDPAAGARLSTYARWWVRAAIQDHVVRSWSLVRVGTTAAQKAMFFHLRRKMVEIRDSADAMTEDVLLPIARRFGVPLKEAAALARRAAGMDWSLNQRIRADEPDEWGDQLADEGGSPEDLAAAESTARYRDGLIAKALASLSVRERAIIAGRYLTDIKKTRDTIAAELGISRERVRQLEIAALEKLRRLIGPKGSEVL